MRNLNSNEISLVNGGIIGEECQCPAGKQLWSTALDIFSIAAGTATMVDAWLSACSPESYPGDVRAMRAIASGVIAGFFALAGVVLRKVNLF